MHLPALPMPLSAIARHAGTDVAVAVAAELAGKGVAFPKTAAAWAAETHGDFMLRMLGPHAQAVLDDVQPWLQQSSRRARTIEIPAAKAARAVMMRNDGMSVAEIAHELLMSRRWTNDIISQYTRTNNPAKSESPKFAR